MFKKVKEANGKRKIYLFGHKIFTYKKGNKINNINNFAQHCKYKNPSEYIRSLGVHVGENVRFIIHPYFFSYPDFGSEPFLIEIGDNTCVSFGVTFLTHDASVHVCEKYIKQNIKLYKYGSIKIGNNCFIGCNTTILPNVTIGNDCIVGAGSIVTKSIPSGEVWAGNPAKFITNINKYTEKSLSLYNSLEQETLRQFVDTQKSKKNN